MTFRPDSAFVDDVHPSPNFGARAECARPKFLVLHYTGLTSAARSIAVLADPVCQVSCHYVIDVDGRTTQMVRETDRAWHAGVSFWQGERDINSHSIGIEIQNPGHEHGYPDFPDTQMVAVETLARDIIVRYTMRPEHVLAHSDIAPQRKIDPGEKFNWQRLARGGVGNWVVPSAPTEPVSDFDLSSPNAHVQRCQQLLAAYGYEVPQSGALDAKTERVVSAFQRHFRPARVDGLVDQSTINTLERLHDSIAV